MVVALAFAFVAGALAFPGYWFWDVLVALTAVLIGLLITGWLLRLFTPSYERIAGWVRAGDAEIPEPPPKPGPVPQARYSDRR